MDYITLKEASQKWNVTPRQINYLCTSGRIPGAVKWRRFGLFLKCREASRQAEKRKQISVRFL